MGFDLKKKKRKRTRPSPQKEQKTQETKKEKRVRERQEASLKKIEKKADTQAAQKTEWISPRKDAPNKKFKHMISVSELPPETQDPILVYYSDWGFDVRVSYVTRQHVQHDIKTLGFSRITHWYPLNDM